MAARANGININPTKLNSTRHESNVKSMDIDVRTLQTKGFHPKITATPIPFTALLTYLDGLSLKYEDLKVCHIPK